MKIKVEYTFITKFGHQIEDCENFLAEDLEWEIEILFPEYANGSHGQFFKDLVKKAAGGEEVIYICEDGSMLEFKKDER